MLSLPGVILLLEKENYIIISQIMAVKEIHTNHERPVIRHTRQGGLYAKPRDILTSKSAQRQLEVIRNSDLLKEVRARKQEK
jgi:3-deoxy-D-arabino-heptulosonate 7-phosphate (DAHP) synthase class II